MRLEFHYPSLKNFVSESSSHAFLIEFKLRKKSTDIEERLKELDLHFENNNNFSYYYLGIVDSDQSARIVTHSIIISSQSLINISVRLREKLINSKFEIYPFNFDDAVMYMLY